MNTRLFYLYRDADNYRKQNQTVIEGELSADDIAFIESTRQEGEYIVPELVGLDCERFSEWDEQSDHPFVELTDDWYEYTTDAPTQMMQNMDGSWGVMTAEQLVSNFHEVMNSPDGWNRPLMVW